MMKTQGRSKAVWNEVSSAKKLIESFRALPKQLQAGAVCKVGRKGIEEAKINIKACKN